MINPKYYIILNLNFYFIVYDNNYRGLVYYYDYTTVNGQFRDYLIMVIYTP